ncbi:hypothetical protein CI105_03380 [Candidatus Izimaplasma bacterium ZiA1]|uniref:hypothetical protein n=1 Tax=Candidatus Izimoplasma sp. ZiA1 TaxID=2024899 RepID=UPI000BAA67D7|nr:hypothetical protein CI105_03380 [Candidatus Izimaplasma bacterium ZiA1]
MEKIEKYKKALVKIRENTSLKKEELYADSKYDESKFEKIKENVIDIYLRMINVTIKQSNQNVDKFIELYPKFFEKIPKNWKTSLDEAKKNNDFENVFIEEIKIETMEKIKRVFENSLGLNNE